MGGYGLIMTNDPHIPGRVELMRLGQGAIISGELATLRQRVGITRNAMAKLIPVTPECLRRWESGAQAISSPSAVRVGEWLWGAKAVIDDLKKHNMNIIDYVPVSIAAQYLGVSMETLGQNCEAEKLRCEDLGVLGLWVLRKDVPSLSRTP